MIESALVKVKAAHAAKDIASIDSSLEELNNAWQAASEELYKAMNDQPGGAQQPGAEGPSASTDDVQDAEIVEEK